MISPLDSGAPLTGLSFAYLILRRQRRRLRGGGRRRKGTRSSRAPPALCRGPLLKREQALPVQWSLWDPLRRAAATGTGLHLEQAHSFEALERGRRPGLPALGDVPHLLRRARLQPPGMAPPIRNPSKSSRARQSACCSTEYPPSSDDHCVMVRGPLLEREQALPVQWST